MNSLFFELIFYFAIYSFLGWVWEVLFHLIKNHRFTDTGFLKGPFCPLYGTCSLIVIKLFSPFQNNLILFYLLSVITATVLEYLTSFIFESLFKIKFWNYSNLKFNLKGRISPAISVFWGFLLLVLVKIIHPAILSVTSKIPSNFIIYFSILFTIYFVIDSTYTLISLFSLKKLLNTKRNMEEINQLLGKYHQHFFKSFSKIDSTKFEIISQLRQRFNQENR